MAFALRAAHIEDVAVRKFLHSRKVSDAMESAGFQSVTAVKVSDGDEEHWFLTPIETPAKHVYALEPLHGHLPLDHPFRLRPLFDPERLRLRKMFPDVVQH